MSDERFKRYFCVEIIFDTPIDFAEQDRLACVVLERLVNEYWTTAREGTKQGNNPVAAIAYRIARPPL